MAIEGGCFFGMAGAAYVVGMWWTVLVPHAAWKRFTVVWSYVKSGLLLE
jgi:hypothetical protein